MKRSLAAIGLLAALAAGPCFGESLMDAVLLAYQTNPTLRGQRAELRAADEGVVQAQAGYGPQVSVTGQASHDASRVQTGPSFFGPATTTDYRAYTGTGDLSIVQPLYTNGAVRAQVSGATAAVIAQRETLREAESELIQSVATAYLDVRRDRETVLVLKDEIAALTNEFAETKAKGALGVLTKTDVAQSEARLLSAQAQLNLAQGKLEDSNAEYLAAVGQSPGELAPEPALEQVPDKIDDAFNAADQNNPKLLTAVANEKVARGKVDEAKAANGPSVALRFDAQVAPEEPYLERQYYDSLTVMATISQPIYTSGLNSSRIRAALDEDDRAQLDVESARRAAVQAVSQAWSEMASTDTAVTIEQRQLTVEQEAVKGNRIEERVGLRQNIELLNAELELTNARIGLVQGRHDAYLARVRLLAAMGLLEVRLLDTHAQTYDPAAAFRAVKGRWQVPWDGIVAAFDSFGAPSTGKPRLSAPDAGSQRPVSVVAP